MTKMCVIVDACLASLVFALKPRAKYQPILDWLNDSSSQGCLVYGGRLAQELGRVGVAREYLLALSRAGRARSFPPGVIEDLERDLDRMGVCRSDDPHVIALARHSGARTLVSEDKVLWDDFRDRALLRGPRGVIYRRPEHRELLRHTASCGHRRTRRSSRRTDG